MPLPEYLFNEKAESKEDIEEREKQETWDELKNQRREIHEMLDEEIDSDGMVTALHPLYGAIIKKKKVKDNLEHLRAKREAKKALKENYLSKLDEIDMDLSFLGELDGDTEQKKIKVRKKGKKFVKNNLLSGEEERESYENNFKVMEDKFNYARE